MKRTIIDASQLELNDRVVPGHVDHPVSGLLLLTSRPLKTWFPFGSAP